MPVPKRVLRYHSPGLRVRQGALLLRPVLEVTGLIGHDDLEVTGSAAGALHESGHPERVRGAEVGCVVPVPRRLVPVDVAKSVRDVVLVDQLVVAIERALNGNGALEAIVVKCVPPHVSRANYLGLVPRKAGRVVLPPPMLDREPLAEEDLEVVVPATVAAFYEIAVALAPLRPGIRIRSTGA